MPRPTNQPPANYAEHLQAPIRPTLNPLFRDFTATPRVPEPSDAIPLQLSTSAVGPASHQQPSTHRGPADEQHGLRPPAATRKLAQAAHLLNADDDEMGILAVHSGLRAGSGYGGDAAAPQRLPLSTTSASSMDADLGSPRRTATHGSGQAASDAFLPASSGLETPVSTPSKAKPATYAAAAASPGPNPAKPPRVAGGSPAGPKNLRAQTRPAGQNQPHRAASMTPPRRRSSDLSGGASGASTHRGAPHPTHRHSGSGDASNPAIEVSSAIAVPVSRAVPPMRRPTGDTARQGGTSAAKQGETNATASSSNVAGMGRAPRVPQLNMAPITAMQHSSGRLAGMAGGHDICKGLPSGPETTSDRPGSGSSARSTSSSSSAPSSDRARSRPSLRNPKEDHPSLPNSNMPQSRQAATIPRLRLNMSQVQSGRNPDGSITGADVSALAGGPGFEGASNTHNASLRAGPSPIPVEGQAQTKAAAGTSRLHRVSGSGSQGDGEDVRPLTTRTERSRSINPFTCLLRMAGAANVRPKASARPSPAGKLPSWMPFCDQSRPCLSSAMGGLMSSVIRHSNAVRPSLRLCVLG